MPPQWQIEVIQESHSIWVLRRFIDQHRNWIESFHSNLAVRNPFDYEKSEFAQVEKVLANVQASVELRSRMTISEYDREKLLQYEGLADLLKTWSRVIDPEINGVLEFIRNRLSGEKKPTGADYSALVRKTKNDAVTKFEGIESEIRLLLDRLDQQMNFHLAAYRTQRETLAVVLRAILEKDEIPNYDREAITAAIQNLQSGQPLDQHFLEPLKPLAQGVVSSTVFELLKHLVLTVVQDSPGNFTP